MNYYTDVLKKYAVFSGRARRKEYWMFTLINIIISIAISIVGSIVGIKQLDGLYSLILFIPSLAVTARRLHDTDRSAWWMLLFFIPIFGWIPLIMFLAKDSQPGSNKYGSNPKEATAAPVANNAGPTN